MRVLPAAVHGHGGWVLGTRALMILLFFLNITAVFALAERPASGATWRLARGDDFIKISFDNRVRNSFIIR